jgi:hypothetical protein
LCKYCIKYLSSLANGLISLSFSHTLSLHWLLKAITSSKLIQQPSPSSEDFKCLSLEVAQTSSQIELFNTRIIIPRHSINLLKLCSMLKYKSTRALTLQAFDL